MEVVNLSGEAGLRLLLCPFGSNVVIRTACCSIGTVLPIYKTFKAIENKDTNEQQNWILFWAVYGSFSVAEVSALLHVKLAFLVWLQLPSTGGAQHLYLRHLCPFLLRHQASLDQIVEFVYHEMSKFIKDHQAEFWFEGAVFMKIVALVRLIVHPLRTQANRAIEGPAEQIQIRNQTTRVDLFQTGIII